MVLRTYELSQGGVSVYASKTLEIGTFMLVELSLPAAEKALHLRAVVRNRRGFRYGLEFVDLAALEQSEIRRYLGAEEGVAES
jgi:hypothetical protein